MLIEYNEGGHIITIGGICKVADIKRFGLINATILGRLRK